MIAEPKKICRPFPLTPSCLTTFSLSFLPLLSSLSISPLPSFFTFTLSTLQSLSPSRLPNQHRMHNDPLAHIPKPIQIDPHFLDRHPPMSNIERQSGGCGFNVGFGVVVVGGGETERDEMAADSAAVVGGEDGEELEDWGVN